MSDSKSGTARAGRTHRILIIDDHPMVRLGISQILAREPDLEVCGETGKASRAIQMLADIKPDLALVDISLEDMSGLDLIRMMRQECPTCRILVCSMHAENLYAERALRAGAAGYVRKSDGGTELVAAVRAVLAGEIYLSHEVSERMLSSLSGSMISDAGPRVKQLSNRELEVFEMIGRGQTSQEIAAGLHLSIKTVDAHRQKIRSKLNLKNNTELVYRAVQWVLEEH